MGTSAPKSGLERRRHPRVRVEVDVDVGSESNFFVGKTRDLSTGGLFIETPIALPIGASVTVELRLKGRVHVIAAEVVWALDAVDGATSGFGVQLNDPSPRTRADILAFMNERAPVDFEMYEPEPEAEVAVAAGPFVGPSCAASSPPPLPGPRPPPFPA